MRILILILSFKYGAKQLNGLAVTSFAVLSFCTQFEQKLWCIQNVYHIFFKTNSNYLSGGLYYFVIYHVLHPRMMRVELHLGRYLPVFLINNSVWDLSVDLK